MPLSRVWPVLSGFQTYYLSWFKVGLEKEYYETTLPARLEKFEALLKSRDEGKGFFLGDKVRARCTHKSYIDYIFRVTTICSLSSLNH